MFLVRGYTTITDIWNAPYDVSIPIKFTLEDAGLIKYTSGNSYDFRISSANGLVKYYPQNLDKAPMPYYNIFLRIMSALVPLFVFYLLHKIIQNAIRETPFLHSNSKKMKWIGFSLIFLGFLSTMKVIAGMDFLESHVSSELISFTTYSKDSSPYNSGYRAGYLMGTFFRSEFVLGLIAIFGSEILRYGISLQEEAELTI